MVAHGPPTSPLAALPPGEPVTLTTTVTAGWESVQQAVGGREWIVRDGAVSISPRPASADEIHARSAVGLTADGRLILAAVDGRRGRLERRHATPRAGRADAVAGGGQRRINLDGGGSTSLAVRRAGTGGPVLVNRPSDGSERAVTNSIQVISNVPTGPLSALASSPEPRSVYRNGTWTSRSAGWMPATTPFRWRRARSAGRVTAPIGTIDATGQFVATAPGTGQVVATANGVTGSAPITVLADTTAPVATPPRVTLPVNRGDRQRGHRSTIAWDAATDDGSGVASYELQRSVDGKAWTTMPKASAAAREHAPHDAPQPDLPVPGPCR